MEMSFELGEDALLLVDQLQENAEEENILQHIATDQAQTVIHPQLMQPKDFSNGYSELNTSGGSMEGVSDLFVQNEMEITEPELEKKLKEDNTVDPFKLGYVDNYEKIMKYLDVKDLLNLSETSKFFYTLVGMASKESMNRIKLVIDEKHNRRFTETVHFTARKYQHIEIKGLFESTVEMSALIKKCADSLITIRSCYDIPVSVELKSVEEVFYYSRDMGSSRLTIEKTGITLAAKNLKRLFIWGNITNPGYVARLIRESIHLEKLVLEYGASVPTMNELDSYNNYDCNLRTLYVDLNNSHQQHNSLMSFLNKQRSSLRDVKLGGPIKVFPEVLKSLPYLERFTFYLTQNPHHFLQYDLIPRHVNLKEANFILPNEKLVTAFLDANPGIESIYISNISKNILKVVTAVAYGTKKLSFAYTTDNSTLEDLKRFYELICDTMKFHRIQLEIVQI